MVSYTMSPQYKGRVPFVPTKRKLLEAAFEMLDIKEGEKVVDIGSGNGQFLTYGAHRVEASFTGIELQKLLVLISRIRSLLTLKRGTIEIISGNYFDHTFESYDKIFMFNMPSEMKTLIPKLAREVPLDVRIASIIFPIESEYFELIETIEKGKDKVFLYKRSN